MLAVPIETVDALLPQTQCRRCGYPDCRSYAQAIVERSEAINRCPPGGEETIARLATLIGRPAIPLDTRCGNEERQASVAFIREAECIGCYRCVRACPVDAIIGASRWTHTVIQAECSGCALCLPACPVDCIELRENRTHPQPARRRAAHWRRRYLARRRRLAQAREQELERRRRGAEQAARERRIAALLAAARARSGDPKA